MVLVLLRLTAANVNETDVYVTHGVVRAIGNAIRIGNSIRQFEFGQLELNKLQ